MSISCLNPIFVFCSIGRLPPSPWPVTADTVRMLTGTHSHDAPPPTVAVGAMARQKSAKALKEASAAAAKESERLAKMGGTEEELRCVFASETRVAETIAKF